MAYLLILILPPLLGGLPLIDWMTRLLTGKRLAQVGTGNVSVSAAFYHGGRVAGILAVLSEAGKGIAVVLLSRSLGLESGWELVGLLGLVVGRYGWGQGAGTTNLTWGYGVHDWQVALGVAAVSGLYFGLTRNRYQSRFVVLLFLPLFEAWRSPSDLFSVTLAIAIGLFMTGVYQQMPDDLDLNQAQGHRSSRSVFRLFQGRSRLLNLADRLQPEQVGDKAASLSQLWRWGYGVPPGWVLRSGQPARLALEQVAPSPQQPWVVRSSAVGEDSLQASAAGQYESILAVTSAEALLGAIQQVRASYDRPVAQQYRRDRAMADAPLAVVIQRQIQGQVSGVAFSRDPLDPGDGAVVIEALPGGAEAVVSGQVTPQGFRIVPVTEPGDRVFTEENAAPLHRGIGGNSPGTTENSNAFAFDRQNPQTWEPILQDVARITRELEQRCHGIPQDVEWTYDGQRLWILQTRPITTLQPLWTRKIAAEVIPGAIRPLTWSLNRPLTCGVWGEIFTIVLGDRAKGLDFQETATLHNAYAYFNATLLGDIFRRMGLPAESLEFLTLGAKFSRPPIASTLGNVPGLMRLLGRIWTLERDFRRDDRQRFQPALSRWLSEDLSAATPPQLHHRLTEIRALLPRATYYQILAPLGFALGRAVLRVADEDLDQGVLPEVAALRSLGAIAARIRVYLDGPHPPAPSPRTGAGEEETLQGFSPSLPGRGVGVRESSAPLQQRLETSPAGAQLWQDLQDCIQSYGYLSEVGTDVAIANWRDDPTPALALVEQFLHNPPPPPVVEATPQRQSWLQSRLALKGKVAQVYLQLLGEVRRSLLALADRGLATGSLAAPDDLFFLTWPELEGWIAALPAASGVNSGVNSGAGSRRSNAEPGILTSIAQRRNQWYQATQQSAPFMVYGFTAALSAEAPAPQRSPHASTSPTFQGIGASRGQVEGVILVVQNLQTWPEIDRQTILVVPYTDAGWAPLLAQGAGVIAETGGRLSHGAIVAREYGIPAVMGLTHALTYFQTGQRVRLDGLHGTVTLLDP